MTAPQLSSILAHDLERTIVLIYPNILNNSVNIFVMKREMFSVFTDFGKASKQYVFLVSGNATLIPEVRGE